MIGDPTASLRLEELAGRTAYAACTSSGIGAPAKQPFEVIR